MAWLYQTGCNATSGDTALQTGWVFTLQLDSSNGGAGGVPAVLPLSLGGRGNAPGALWPAGGMLGWSRAPWTPSGAMRHLHPGRSWFSEAKLPSGPETYMLWNGDTPCPPPQRGQERGAGLPVRRWSGESHAVLGMAGRSVLLLLLGHDYWEFVLNPEASHEEVDDGTVEVLPEGGAVEVMAFVRVDL